MGESCRCSACHEVNTGCCTNDLYPCAGRACPCTSSMLERDLEKRVSRTYGAGTAGCPYDPHGENTYMVYKQDCPCLYQGAALPSDLYTNYPTSNPGEYAGLTQIHLYGTTCAAWDQSPETPWFSSCPSGADWCSYDHNWCQAPWCYVSDSCSTGVGPSSRALPRLTTATRRA